MTLGAVIISRNDGYGGDQPAKAIYALTSMINAMDEVVYVDWNSPGNVSLIEVIRGQLPKTGKLRHIQVTQAMHAELTNGNPDVQNCVEVLARNIGLRRLKSDYLVSTNGDIMCLDRASIEQGIIDEQTFHCVARRETPFDEVYEFSAVRDLGDYTQEILWERIDEFPQHGSGSPLGPSDPWSLITCPGDFQLAHRDLWHTIRGFEESLVMRGYSDSNVQRKADFYGFKLALVRDIPVFHFQHYPDTGASGGNTMGWNDRAAALDNFQGTANPTSWGFARHEFEEEVI